MGHKTKGRRGHKVLGTKFKSAVALGALGGTALAGKPAAVGALIGIGASILAGRMVAKKAGAGIKKLKDIKRKLR